ncbi:MAG: acetolactate synthase large subunit [Patescibacteria group bacterium]
MTVAERIIKTLENHGVCYVFGVPGEEVEDLLFALSKSKKIKFIATRHEQGAAFMADVWGRLTGRAGVCLATLGPGATNLLSGIADSFLDKAPLLAITGQADSMRHHKDSHQYIDVAGIFKPVTKWNTVILNPKDAAFSVSKAIQIAEAEKPGATHIDLPEDIAEMTCPPLVSPAGVGRREVKKPKAREILKAVSLIKKSKRPIIFSGNGVVRKNNSSILQKIAETFNIPVFTTFMGKGAISDRSPLSLKSVGLKANDFQKIALAESDLVICVGVDHGEWSPNNWAAGKNIIHIDHELDFFYKSYSPEVELLGGIKSSLEMLFSEIKKAKVSKFDSWYTEFRIKILEDHKYWEKYGKNITAPFVLGELRKAMNDEDIILSDVGAHKMWIARNFDAYKPNTCIIPNGLAAMGIALPGGLAAKLAFPKLRVVSVMGDGGFMMNSQEIETAKRIGVPFTIVVLNDNDYGLISWKQATSRGKSFGTKLSNPDFVKYAESFGIKAYHPKSRKDVGAILQKAINSNELCLVAIDIDPSVNLELTKRLKDLK